MPPPEPRRPSAELQYTDDLLRRMAAQLDDYTQRADALRQKLGELVDREVPLGQFPAAGRVVEVHRALTRRYVDRLDLVREAFELARHATEEIIAASQQTDEVVQDALRSLEQHMESLRRPRIDRR
jgi:hypothetical protein